MGLFPEAEGVGQELLLLVLYSYFIFKGSKLLADGSDILRDIYGAGIVGGIVIPILGALPDGFIVLFSGLAAGTHEEIQDRLNVGIGALAGATVMLITVPVCIGSFIGARQLDEEGRAMSEYQPIAEGSNKLVLKPVAPVNWSLTENGITALPSTPRASRWMILTCVTFLVIQIPAFFYRHDEDGGTAHERIWAVIGIIISMILFFAYLIAMWRDSDSAEMVEERRQRVHKFMAWSSENKSLIGALDPVTLFNILDKDGDGLLDAEDLRLGFKTMGLRLNHAEAQAFFNMMDADGNIAVDITEFVSFVREFILTSDTSIASPTGATGQYVYGADEAALTVALPGSSAPGLGAGAGYQGGHGHFGGGGMNLNAASFARRSTLADADLYPTSASMAVGSMYTGRDGLLAGAGRRSLWYGDSSSSGAAPSAAAAAGPSGGFGASPRRSPTSRNAPLLGSDSGAFERSSAIDITPLSVPGMPIANGNGIGTRAGSSSAFSNATAGSAAAAAGAGSYLAVGSARKPGAFVLPGSSGAGSATSGIAGLAGPLPSLPQVGSSDSWTANPDLTSQVNLSVLARRSAAPSADPVTAAAAAAAAASPRFPPTFQNGAGAIDGPLLDPNATLLSRAASSSHRPRGLSLSGSIIPAAHAAAAAMGTAIASPRFARIETFNRVTVDGDDEQPIEIYAQPGRTDDVTIDRTQPPPPLPVPLMQAVLEWYNDTVRTAPALVRAGLRERYALHAWATRTGVLGHISAEDAATGERVMKLVKLTTMPAFARRDSSATGAYSSAGNNGGGASLPPPGTGMGSSRDVTGGATFPSSSGRGSASALAEWADLSLPRWASASDKLFRYVRNTPEDARTLGLEVGSVATLGGSPTGSSTGDGDLPDETSPVTGAAAVSSPQATVVNINFPHLSKNSAPVSSVIAGSGEPRSIHDLFVEADIHRNGALTVTDVIAFAERFELNISKVAIKVRFHTYDSDLDRTLSLPDFRKFLEDLVAMPAEAEAHAADAAHKSVENVRDEVVVASHGHMAMVTHGWSERKKKFYGVGLLCFGMSLVAFFSDPLIEVITGLGGSIGIRPFYISFIVTPFASNAAEVIAALMFARSKTNVSMALTLSSLYGAVTMNNTLCVAIFLSILLIRNLAWRYTAEVMTIITIQFAVAFLVRRETIRLWQAALIGLLFPAAIGMVYTLEMVLDR